MLARMLAGLPRKYQRIAANAAYPRHTHAQAYAAIVLDGGYVEAGSHGRWRVGAGDVLLHGAFDAHCDSFDRGACAVVNLALPRAPRFAAGRIDDADAILRADPREAAELLLASLRPRDDGERDWPDLLAASLRRDPSLHLAEWARAHRLSAETLSRGFLRVYGTVPARFRAETRARKAYAMIAEGMRPLAEIALASGFSDQPHMTRAIVALTGHAPRQIRSRRARDAAPS